MLESDISLGEGEWFEFQRHLHRLQFRITKAHIILYQQLKNASKIGVPILTAHREHRRFLRDIDICRWGHPLAIPAASLHLPLIHDTSIIIRVIANATAYICIYPSRLRSPILSLCPWALAVSISMEPVICCYTLDCLLTAAISHPWSRHWRLQ